MDFNGIAKQFVSYYYSTFDSNRALLKSLYRDNSMLTFEGQPLLGVAAIMEKLSSLPFQKVDHKTTTLDAQPSFDNTGILVLVTGLLFVDGSPNGLQFSQTFHLIPDSPSFYVHNDVFRLNYG